VWSPDGQFIAYLSDRTGEYEIYLRPQRGGDEVRITTEGQVYRSGLRWSPDSEKLLFEDSKLRLWYVDITEREPVLVHQAKYRGTSHTAWSPDSRFIAFTSVSENFKSTIQLYSLGSGEIVQASDGTYDDTEPVFDPSGKYLYFLSSRYFHPAGDQLDWHFAYFNATGIFALVLAADGDSPFPLRSDEEPGKETGNEEDDAPPKNDDEEKKETRGKEAKGKDPKKGGETEGEETTEPTRIDFEGLAERVVAFPVSPGNYSGLAASEGSVFYLSVPFRALQRGRDGGGDRRPATLHVYDLEKREEKVLLEGVDGYTLDGEGKKLLYLAGRKLGIVDAAPGKAKVGDGALAVGELRARVDPPAEWRQIFDEAWRIERDFYWDPEMGGLDWRAIGERYRALLPWVAHRSDLNYLIGELIGELSTSHAYVGGGKMPASRRIPVGLLGVDFATERGAIRIATIYRGSSWEEGARSPLATPGIDVREGDYLIRVNGRQVSGSDNPYAHFQGLTGKVVELEVSSDPAGGDARTVLVKPVASEVDLRYLSWVEANRRKVAEATGGRIGYIHVPDTAVEGLQEFDRTFSAQLGAEGLIVDERYNRGGWMPSFYTEKLGRRLLAMVAPRAGADLPWPPTVIPGPKVMIINERAGSGGDAFPFFFRKEGIGSLVGTRTWGGLVGISRRIPMMDGGQVTAPEVGFWDPDTGEWVAENRGIAPDVEVRQLPDQVVAGRDPQLERAIEIVLEALEEQPAKEQRRPPYPRRK
jgi:tricorn protease